MLSDELAPALFRAILDVFPVLGPLLTPFESPTAAQASFWLKAIFGLWGWAHVFSLIRPQRQVLNNLALLGLGDGTNQSRVFRSLF